MEVEDIRVVVFSLLPDTRPCGAVSREWCATYRASPDYKMWAARPAIRPKFVLPKHVPILDYLPRHYAHEGNAAALFAAPFNYNEVLTAAARAGKRRLVEKLLTHTKCPVEIFHSMCALHAADYPCDAITQFLLDMPSLKLLKIPIPKILSACTSTVASQLIISSTAIHPENIPQLFRHNLTPAARTELLDWILIEILNSARNLDVVRFSKILQTGAGNPAVTHQFIRAPNSFGDEISLLAMILTAKRYNILTPHFSYLAEVAPFSRSFIARLRQ